MMQDSTRPSFQRRIYWFLFLLVFAALAAVALLIPWYTSLVTPTWNAGQVAGQDIQAPKTITFTSDVLTLQRQDAAERGVQPVYTRPDPSIARQQLERLRSSLAYITSVRSDANATQEQKLADLSALEGVHLSQPAASAILTLSDPRWQSVQQEAIVVLEQVMRGAVREDRLEDVRSGLPALINLSLSETQVSIIAELAPPYIVPNSLYSEELTFEARQNARESVTPTQRTFISGETVVSRGQVLSEADIEALQQLGLSQPTLRWQDPVGALSLVFLITAFITFYIRRTPALFEKKISLALMAALFLAFLTGGRLLLPGHTVIPYAFPVSAFGLAVTALLGAQLAMVTSLPLAILLAYGLPNALDLSLYFAMSSLFSILALGRARRVTSFFWAGLTVAVTGAVIVLAYRLPDVNSDWVGITTLTGASFFNGLASASLAIVLQFILAHFLGLTSPMQLMELTRPDHPLLHRILHEAPGTYQHSLQVANLAEQAGERIGADSLLIRVGALYHDVGKTTNPMFFIENQLPGFLNPHDDLDPATSAATIIRHVTDGLDLARKHRLPRRIIDFIAEHHGTMITRYQYVNAVKAAGGDESRVNMEDFRYPGPAPQSRETAILMLADGAEARVRAERPKDEVELRGVIRNVIDTRISIGELDDTDLTLRDLDKICDSFTATLRGIYHPRVQYPKLEPVNAAAPVGPPLLEAPETEENKLSESHASAGAHPPVASSAPAGNPAPASNPATTIDSPTKPTFGKPVNT